MPDAHLSRTDLLASSLTMGAVSLNVRNVTEMREFYTTAIGLEEITRNDAEAILGVAGLPIVSLHTAPELLAGPPGSAGLYHLAIVHTSRGRLARTVDRMLASVPEQFVGSADHLVSEAFYVADPEGNGIELYYDRDPSTWSWENGMVAMDSLYLPPETYVLQHASEKDEGTMKIGHVHLKVGNIERARYFYVEIVGLSITAQLPSALFVSVNRYHHHLGMNTWESLGAGKRGESLGLRSFVLLLPDTDAIARLSERLKSAGMAYEQDETGIAFYDPWNNRLTARVSS